MLNRWAGPLITLLIVGGVGLILIFNLNPKSPQPAIVPKPAPAGAPAPKSRIVEHPIGDKVERANEHLRVEAVWLPPIQMDGMPDPGSDVVHLEADVKATEENPNGFAKYEFIPYLKIRYKIVPANGGPPIHEGELAPMVAADGLHYGASISMPKAGAYRLIYDVQPPSAGGLGRHSDPATGVAPWWKPFQASFDWDYPGPPRPGASP